MSARRLIVCCAAAALLCAGGSARAYATDDQSSPTEVAIVANPTSGSTYAMPTAASSSTPNGGWSQFLNVTCGSNCADPLGEMSAAQSNWAALQQMGDTGYVGASYNGMTLDASSLLAAARVVGATQLDDWLRTGDVPSQSVADMIATALSTGAGYDVSSVTGSVTPPTSSTDNSSTSGADMTAGSGSSSTSSSLASQLSTAFNLAQGIMSDGQNLLSAAGNGTSLCKPQIASAQNANAQSFITNMMTLITGQGTGFSQLGGGSVGTGARSASGVFGSGCLDKLMSGSMDTLFSPPGLSGLIGQLGSMFGGMGGATSGATGSSSSSSSSSSSQAGCSNNPTPLQQVNQSMPQGIFFASAGGFLPFMNFTGGEGTTATSMIPAASSASSSVSGGLSGLFASNSSGSYGSSGSGYVGSTTSSGTYAPGSITYPDGSTGSPTQTPSGGGFQSQGKNPSLDSKLLQGHAITLPGN